MINKLFQSLFVLVFFIQCKSVDEAQNTGWASYSETTFSRENPKEVKKGETYYFKWSNIDSITLERPIEIDTWIRNNRFAPKDIGAGFLVRVDLDLK